MTETGVPRTEEEALKKVTVQFEAFFIGAMLKQMRSTTLESDLFGNDRASKIYREMHDEALASEMAKTGALGIGEMMFEELRAAAAERTAPEAYKVTAAGGA